MGGGFIRQPYRSLFGGQRNITITDKYKPKPNIWTDWDKFLGAQKNMSEKASALDAALKGGDKDKVQAAFADAGKNGCGGCHKDFREEIKN